jgi:Redoxin
VNLAWETVAIAGWAVLLVNLLVTLRLVRWLRSYRDAGRLDHLREDIAELTIGGPAPAFAARDLGGVIVKSADFADRETAFVFVSPQCGICRREMPELVKLAALARTSAAAEIVLVSGSGAGETQYWLQEIRQDDEVDVELRVLVARMRMSDFQATYNPRGLTPYFCYVDKTGIVTARGGLHTPAWASLIRKWNPAAASARNLQRYR